MSMITGRQIGRLQGIDPDAPCRPPDLSGSDSDEKRPRILPPAKEKDHPAKVQTALWYRGAGKPVGLDPWRQGASGQGEDPLLLPIVPKKKLRRTHGPG